MIYFASYFHRNHHVGKVMSISITQPGNYEEFDLLFPSVELFYQRKNNEISWMEFKEQYREVLETRREEIIDVLNDLEDDVTFCCWEKQPYNCHRIIAFDFLKEVGYNVVLN